MEALVDDANRCPDQLPAHVKWLPPGFKFHPTDEELITYYLATKTALMNGTRSSDLHQHSIDAITELDLNNHEPWDIPGKVQTIAEKEYYFFSVKDKKYPSGSRTNRATRAGYWKATGKDKDIFMKVSRSGPSSQRTDDEEAGYGAAAAAAAAGAAVVDLSKGSCNTMRLLVGMKKTLVFYQGRAPRGLKSNWVMHEYRLHERLQRKLRGIRDQTRVLCRVLHKRKPQPTMNEEPGSHGCCPAGAPQAPLADQQPWPSSAGAEGDDASGPIHILQGAGCSTHPRHAVQYPNWPLPAASDINKRNGAEPATASGSPVNGQAANIAGNLPDVAAAAALPDLADDESAALMTTACRSWESATSNGGDLSIWGIHSADHETESNTTTLSNEFDSTFESGGYVSHSNTNSLPRFPSELESLWLYAPPFPG